jgi:hypothetical protein
MTVRVTLNKTPVLGSYPSLQPVAGSMDLIETAADASNKNQFAASGNDLVIAHNSGGSPYTVTITSVADDEGRTGDITAYSVAAGGIAFFGPFKRHGWAQADGMIYLEASNASVKFGVLALP